MSDNLTPKQEAFCLRYIETGDASEAYRLSYDAENMKPVTINRKAKELLDNGKIAKGSIVRRDGAKDARRFYVYHLIDPRDDRVFYVGKGSGNRPWQHEADAVARRHINIEKETLIRRILKSGQRYGVAIIYRDCTEEEAFELESKEIARIGYGNLTNIEKNTSAGNVRAYLQGMEFIKLLRWNLRGDHYPREKRGMAYKLINEMNENLSDIVKMIGSKPIAIALSY